MRQYWRFILKAEIKNNGTLHIKAENTTEAFALMYLNPVGENCICDKCKRQIPRFEYVIDCSILNEKQIK